MEIKGVLNTYGSYWIAVGTIDPDDTDIEELVDDVDEGDTMSLDEMSPDIVDWYACECSDCELQLFKDNDKSPFMTLSGDELKKNIVVVYQDLEGLFTPNKYLGFNEISNVKLMGESGYFYYFIINQYNKHATAEFSIEVDQFDIKNLFLISANLEAPIDSGVVLAVIYNEDKTIEKFMKDSGCGDSPDDVKGFIAEFLEGGDENDENFKLELIDIELTESGSAKGQEVNIYKAPFEKSSRQDKYQYDPFSAEQLL